MQFTTMNILVHVEHLVVGYIVYIFDTYTKAHRLQRTTVNVHITSVNICSYEMLVGMSLHVQSHYENRCIYVTLKTVHCVVH